jgi:hypothetical protein
MLSPVRINAGHYSIESGVASRIWRLKMAYFLLAVKLCRDLLFFSIFWRIVFG